MPAYFLAALDIKDAEGYRQYVERAGATLSGIKIVPLSIDHSPVLLEGELPSRYFALFEFESQEEIQRWYHSEAYQQARGLRLASADTAFIVSLAGLPTDPAAKP